MMYFFTPGSSVLFALVGLGLIAWLAGAFAKSAAGGVLSGADLSNKRIQVNWEQSTDGKYRVRYANFNNRTKIYYAEIVESATGKYVGCTTAKTPKELEENIERFYKGKGCGGILK